MNIKYISKTNVKLIIGSVFLVLSGWLIGYGIDSLFPDIGCMGVKTGLGISLFIIGIILIRLYFIETDHERRKDMYSKQTNN